MTTLTAALKEEMNRLFKMKVKNGCLLKTSAKFSKYVISLGKMVGGKLRISSGVLKAVRNIQKKGNISRDEMPTARIVTMMVFRVFLCMYDIL
jgi:hypothetical protein